MLQDELALPGDGVFFLPGRYHNIIICIGGNVKPVVSSPLHDMETVKGLIVVYLNSMSSKPQVLYLGSMCGVSGG